MSQLPRFMIAFNPMADLSGEYVYHTQEPRFLAKRVYGNPVTDFEIVQEIDHIGDFYKNDVTRMAGLMRRLGDWYIAYKTWEKKNEH